MLQFDTTTVVASNPFSVNGKQFLPTIVKCSAICETGAARHRRCARALERTPWGRARSLEGWIYPFRAVRPRIDPGPCYASTFAAGQPENAKLSDA
jgi:hypothetical protein